MNRPSEACTDLTTQHESFLHEIGGRNIGIALAARSLAAPAQGHSRHRIQRIRRLRLAALGHAADASEAPVSGQQPIRLRSTHAKSPVPRLQHQIPCLGATGPVAI
jgi:hypothetical protein